MERDRRWFHESEDGRWRVPLLLGAFLLLAAVIGRGLQDARPAAASGQPVGLGAFVDLAYWRYSAADHTTFNTAGTPSASMPKPLFADLPAYPSMLTVPADIQAYRNKIQATFDTWALSYERDGIDQAADGSYDRGVNGNDDDGKNGVDDVGELETVPPYGDAPRGIRVLIRLYEPGTRQVRQASVAGDFVTE